MNTTSSLIKLLERLPAKIAHFRIARNMRSVRKTKHLLVVEDQLFSRRLLQQVLRDQYTLDQAATTQEGLLLFLENAPDVVLLDIELQDESGHSLAQAIRAIDPDVRLIMVTANHSVEDVALAKSNNVSGFIVKPYSKKKILESLESTFAGRTIDGGLI